MSTVQDELMHYGVLGMKWGKHRFQNEDGTLTKAGQKKLALNTKNTKQQEISFLLETIIGRTYMLIIKLLIN